MTAMLLLGATGDLTRRHLLPALAHLEVADRLPADLRVIAVSREELDDETFRRHAVESLQRHAPELSGTDIDNVARQIGHLTADVTETDDLRRVLDTAGSPVIVYLALPSTVFAPTLRALAGAGLPKGSCLVLEKPFGTDAADARRLNGLVRELVPESSVFRVDYFLAKQTVLNVLGLRFANRLLEPLWHSGHVERVDIVWDETLGVEGRAGYYDSAGALRDMVQNHLLQLLALVAMEPPTSMGERDLRDRKLDVLRAVRSPSAEEVASSTVRARYTAGDVRGRRLPDYVEEPGVDPARGTETFAEVRLFVDNWRWAGVPFVLRTGKALGRDRREIAVTFRPVPHLTFGPAGAGRPNVLRMTLDPDRIALQVNLNGAEDPFDLEPAQLAADFPPAGLPPYGQVLSAVLAGDPTLSIRGDEAEESWRIVQPILDAWAAGAVPLAEYPAGSAGPGPQPGDRTEQLSPFPPRLVSP